MATTVHLPPGLLEQVDRRARQLGLSRNRYIRQTLESALQHDAAWSRDFVQALQRATVDKALQEGVDEMMKVIATRRSRKKPPSL